MNLHEDDDDDKMTKDITHRKSQQSGLPPIKNRKNYTEREEKMSVAHTTQSHIIKNDDYDKSTIKNCIDRISDLNMKQVDREFKETARNRKVNNIGSYKNMTIGQAYYNLNKTMNSFSQTGDFNRNT